MSYVYVICISITAVSIYPVGEHGYSLEVSDETGTQKLCTYSLEMMYITFFGQFLLVLNIDEMPRTETTVLNPQRPALKSLKLVTELCTSNCAIR